MIPLLVVFLWLHATMLLQLLLLLRVLVVATAPNQSCLLLFRSLAALPISFRHLPAWTTSLFQQLQLPHSHPTMV